MQQTAYILVNDDKFGGRAESRAIRCGDAILPLVVRESQDFKKLNGRNAFWITEVLGSIKTERAKSLAYDLYRRSERLQHIVGSGALANKGLLDSRGVDDLIGIAESGAGAESELAIIALGKSGATRAAPVLVELLGKQPPDYWRDAYICDAIARLRYAPAVGVLESSLRSKEFHALPNAFRALITLGDRDAVPLAIQRVEPEIQNLNSGFVVMELQKVTGQRLGYDRRSWMNWWNSAKPSWTIPPAFRKRYDEQPTLY